MLYKIRTQNDLAKIEGVFPITVDEEIKRVIAVLDENYENDKGGFVAVVETELDLEELEQYHFDCQTDVCEFVDIIGDSGWICKCSVHCRYGTCYYCHHAVIN